MEPISGQNFSPLLAGSGQSPLGSNSSDPWKTYKTSLPPRAGPVANQGFTDISGENLKKGVFVFPTQSERMTENEMFSEEFVIPSTRVSSLTDYSHSAPVFLQGPLDNDSWPSHSSESSFFNDQTIPHDKSIILPRYVRFKNRSKIKGGTDQVQELRTEKKQKEEAFPQKRAQSEPLSDTASFSALRDRKIRNQCQSSHEVSDELRLSSGLGQRHGFQRPSLFSSCNFSNPWHRSSSEKRPVFGQGFTNITGKSLKRGAGGFPVQVREHGGDHGAKKETWPPFTTKYSRIGCAATTTDPQVSMSGMMRSPPSAADVSPGISQDDTREMEPPATADLSTLQLFTNDETDDDECYDFYKDLDDVFQESAVLVEGSRAQDESDLLSVQSGNESGDSNICQESLSPTGVGQDNIREMEPPNRAGLSTLQLYSDNEPDDEECYELDEDSDPEVLNKTLSSSASPPAQSCRDDLGSVMCFKTTTAQDESDLLSLQYEIETRDSDVLMEMEPPVQAKTCSTTNTLPTLRHLQTSSDPGWTERVSRCLTRSHSFPSLSQKTSAKSFRRSHSFPDGTLKNFTPDITADGDDETFSFRCCCPGLYQCSVTGLLFHMEGGGDLVYRVVPWNRSLLAQYHKQPAGPLFDIKCEQQSVCRLHLPHCEIRSTGGRHFLSVAHVNNEGIEFIRPHEVTETHVVVNITGFSAFGNVKDEDSPPEPVQALVLLFYRPPADPDPESLLNVLLLPRNVVLRDVVRWRKKFVVGDERHIETFARCKLHPKQKYTLSTRPEDSVLVQPREAEFDEDSYENYFPSFQVDLDKMMKHIQLFLKDKSSHSVWERRVCLSSTGVKRSCEPSALNLPPDEKLLNIRSSFIDGISGPVLKSLVDNLFEKKVMTESERESADDIQNKRDKARFVIDTVRKKGEAASSEMIEFLCEIDPFLCEHLDLI